MGGCDPQDAASTLADPCTDPGASWLFVDRRVCRMLVLAPWQPIPAEMGRRFFTEDDERSTSYVSQLNVFLGVGCDLVA